MKSKLTFLLVAVSVLMIIISSFLAIKVMELQNETTALKKETGEFWLIDRGSVEIWIVKYIGKEPVASEQQAGQTYLVLIDKTPSKTRNYWIHSVEEDMLGLEVSETNDYYCVNGAFRNYAVNCPNAKITIKYNVFKNGTATLESIETICPRLDGGEDVFQQFP